MEDKWIINKEMPTPQICKPRKNTSVEQYKKAMQKLITSKFNRIAAAFRALDSNHDNGIDEEELH